MYRDAALDLIKRHESELRKLGIVRLSLFGSTARDEAGSASDIDVAVRLENVPSGFAYFGRLDAITERLAQILGTSVDVVPEPAPAPRVQEAIERDRCRAF